MSRPGISPSMAIRYMSPPVSGSINLTAITAPGPFCPYHSTRKGSTVHFRPDRNTRASVKIYDFNLELVKTVAVDRDRIGGVESDDIVWDGTNDKGKIVANGIYFYRVELDYG